jgi:hypothetical protein
MVAERSDGGMLWGSDVSGVVTKRGPGSDREDKPATRVFSAISAESHGDTPIDATPYAAQCRRQDLNLHEHG